MTLCSLYFGGISPVESFRELFFLETEALPTMYELCLAVMKGVQLISQSHCPPTADNKLP